MKLKTATLRNISRTKIFSKRTMNKILRIALIKPISRLILKISSFLNRDAKKGTLFILVMTTRHKI